MHTYHNFVGRLIVLGLSVIVVAGSLSANRPLQAANLFWEGRTIESGGVFDSNWNVGGAVNWNLNTEAGTLVTFNNGDAVTFKDDGGGNNDNTTVVIAAGGVSPSSTTFNRGFGVTYNISGGDILTGAINGVRDDTKIFTRDASYSFPGGTFATAGGSHFQYITTSPGTYQFGSGAITVQSGTFTYNPASPSTISNNFILTGGGTISGNANASFSGNLTISSNLLTLPQNTTFPFPSVTITQNTTIETTRCCGAAPVSQLTADILGTGNENITLQGSLTANADWQSRIDAPANIWDVKDIAKTGRTMLYLNGSMSKFFDGMNSNGGKFYHRGGSIRFTSATPNINFGLLMDPAAAMIGVNPFETGAGFNTTSQLNIVAGGLLGGNGTVAADNNLNGGLPTFESNVNVTVSNGGQISPGLSAGILSVRGNVSFLDDTSELVIELGGTSPGTQYDRLNLTGIASLDGLLDVSFINGFEDTILNSDTFTIMNAASINGMFDNINLGRVETSDGTGSFLASIVGNSLILSDFQPVPAPEPSTALLLLTGLVGLRRRKK